MNAQAEDYDQNLDIKPSQLDVRIGHFRGFRAYAISTQISCTGPGPIVNHAYPKNIFSYFSAKTYVVGTQKNCLNETVLLRTQNIC